MISKVLIIASVLGLMASLALGFALKSAWAKTAVQEERIEVLETAINIAQEDQKVKDKAIIDANKSKAILRTKYRKALAQIKTSGGECDKTTLSPGILDAVNSLR